MFEFACEQKLARPAVARQFRESGQACMPRTQSAENSKMSSFSRCGPPTVVAPVSVVYRRRNELCRLYIIQGRQLNRDIGATDLFDIASPEWPDAAGSAEVMMCTLRSELIVSEGVFTCEKTERLRLDDCAPVPGLCTYCAVALSSTGAQVNIRLKANGATVATPGVRLLHTQAPVSDLRSAEGFGQCACTHG